MPSILRHAQCTPAPGNPVSTESSPSSTANKTTLASSAFHITSALQTLLPILPKITLHIQPLWSPALPGGFCLVTNQAKKRHPKEITMPNTTITTKTATYTIVEKIGQGCSGTVFLARNPEGMPVAVKKASNIHSNLLHERTILTKVHETSPLPGVPQLLDSLDEGEETILVMEYIEGTPLYDLHGRFFSTEQAITTVTALYRIVAQLHQQGVAHSDLHMRNILWSKDERMAVIDLGNATIPMSRHHRAYRHDVRDLLCIGQYWLYNMAQDPDCPLRKTLGKWTQDTLDKFYGPLTLPASAITLLQRWEQVVQQMMASSSTVAPQTIQ
jgi:serine/threonine protein kinase